MLKRFVLPAALFVIAGTASAQSSTPAAASAGTAAKPAVQLTPQQIAVRKQAAQRAEQVATLVDQGNEGQVWDEASAVMKQVAPRDRFVSGITSDRSKLGNVVSRKVARVFPVKYAEGGSTPAGVYMNVVFATQFSNGKQPQFEEVSFHLDKDNVWRTSGYTLRPPQPKKPH